MKVKCLQCSKEFNSYPSRQKIGKGLFCSKECLHKYHTKECVCGYCGKKYNVPISQRGDKYCSMECYTKSKEFEERKEKLSKSYSKKIEIVCPECGKVFKVSPSRLKDNKGKFCSLECRNKSYLLPKEVLAEHKREYTKKYRKENNDWYISMKQKRRALKNNLGGVFTKEEWSDLKDKYNHTCPHCGKSEPEIKLTVDHIIPLSKWNEWIKTNIVTYKCNDIENIQPLCGRCNSEKWSKLL